MLNRNLHPSDQDLLLFSDGELSTRRAARVRKHLAACWSCRARAAQIEVTIGEFLQMHRLDSLELPPLAGPRALLKARLAQSVAQNGGGGWQPSLLSLQARSLAYLCALAIVVVLGTRMLLRNAVEHETGSAEYAGLLPNPALTPGATRPIGFDDICSMDHDEVVIPISASMRQKIFDEYGIGGRPFEDYEVDYLITPGLGGSDDIRNLWPQPRYNAMWNSFVKDRLEDYLHQMVCQRRLSLATAQKDVATDWISAYKKYFHSNTPLSSAASGARAVQMSAISIDFTVLPSLTRRD
jgi:hypothetical protein